MPDDDDLWAAPDQRGATEPTPEPHQPLTEGAWAPPSGPPVAPRTPNRPPAPTGARPGDPSGRHAAPAPDAVSDAAPAPSPYAAPAPADGPVAPAYLGAPAYPRPAAATTEPSRARLPGWAWPAVALVALVFGIVGSLVGSAIGDRGTVPGGLLQVEKRTAAPLAADNASVPAVAQKLLPSTVQIVAEYGGDARGATGSGWVLDRQGHIVTNNHVVADAARDGGNIEVVDQQGTRSKATVVGRSAVYDVAVLQSDGAKDLTPVALGSSRQMRVGETVVAIGSPLGLSSTVTSGIVSALDRPVTTGDGADDQSYIDAVQTDAAINPGNSGGPLVDLQGKVVAMNSAIASLGSLSTEEGGSIGVGFAIPIEQIEVTTDQILRSGRAEYPYIGAGVGATSDQDGALITSVATGDPAARAGLRKGDVVTGVDGKPVTTSAGLVVVIRSHVRGDELALRVERGGASRTVRVTLGARPDKG